MLNIIQNEETIQFKLSSEIKIVNNVIQNVRSYLKQYSIEDGNGMIITLRELLNNAIEHGNKKKKELNVVVSIERISDMRFKIVVEDEGDGFDYQDIQLSMPDDPNQIRNRGLSLANAFSDQLEFNKRGNRITAYITIRPETGFNVTYDGRQKIIKPTGDITAETSEQFRTLLLNLLNEGHSMYCFDLSDVQDIDSIALSIFVIFSNMVSDRFPNAKLKIINMSKDIVNLFRMTRLDQNYKIS